MQVRIREVFKTIDRRNPISGHEWTEHGPTTGYEVVGPFGVLEKCRTEVSAVAKAYEWQAFYDKCYPQEGTQTKGGAK